MQVHITVTRRTLPTHTVVVHYAFLAGFCSELLPPAILLQETGAVGWDPDLSLHSMQDTSPMFGSGLFPL